MKKIVFTIALAVITCAGMAAHTGDAIAQGNQDQVMSTAHNGQAGGIAMQYGDLPPGITAESNRVQQHDAYQHEYNGAALRFTKSGSGDEAIRATGAVDGLNAPFYVLGNSAVVINYQPKGMVTDPIMSSLEGSNSALFIATAGNPSGGAETKFISAVFAGEFSLNMNFPSAT